MDDIPEGVLDDEQVDGLRVLTDSIGRDGFREFLGTFNDNSSKILDQMHEAAVSGDATELARLAHSLKGSAAALGGKRLAGMCADIEVLLNSGEASKATSLVDDLPAELKAVHAALVEALCD